MTQRHNCCNEMVLCTIGMQLPLKIQLALNLRTHPAMPTWNPFLRYEQRRTATHHSSFLHESVHSEVVCATMRAEGVVVLSGVAAVADVSSCPRGWIVASCPFIVVSFGDRRRRLVQAWPAASICRPSAGAKRHRPSSHVHPSLRAASSAEAHSASLYRVYRRCSH